MKKIITTVLCIILTVNVFALKLPNGDNVRTDDVVMDGDSIVEVKLKEDAKITIPLNGQQLVAYKGEPVKFYKSGALKSFEVRGRSHDVEGRSHYYEPQSIKLMEQEVQIHKIIEFYESGALKKINIIYETPLQINIEDSTALVFYSIIFYDSGSSNVFRVYSGYLKENIEIDRNGNKIHITSGASGSEFLPSYEFYLYEDGKLKMSSLVEGITVKTNMGELFAGKGEISFWENESVKSFINDDTIIDTIAGIKVTIPSGKKIEFYKNGNIKNFYVSNETQFKLGTNTYTTIKGNTDFPFVINEDGTIISTPWVYWNNNNDRIFSDRINIVSFDSKLEPRIVYFNYYLTYVIYNKEIKARLYEKDIVIYKDNSVNTYNTIDMGYQPGDTGKDIWMVYFDSKGMPSTYCVYDKITGERNTEKKQFVRKK